MSGHLARGVSILGAAYTPLGLVGSTPQIKDYSERELLTQAAFEAMEDAHVTGKDIDAFNIGESGPNIYSSVKSAGPQYSDWLGMHLKPGIFHDEACASAGFGVNDAVMQVASGAYDIVLAGSVQINSTVPEKSGYPPQFRRKLSPEELFDTVLMATDPAYEKPGTGGFGPVETILVRYVKQYGLSYDDVDEMFVNYLMSQRNVALKNPKATLITQSYEDEARQFGFDNVHDYLFSNKYNPLMGTLLRGRFVGQMVDGAAAVIVAATDVAKKYVDHPIEVAGFSQATALNHTFMNVPDPGDVKMFKEAYSMAGITDPVSEVDWAGIHDCPASMIAPVAEAAGYIPEGQAWKYMRDGKVGPDGPKPINTDGGRTQTGHPDSPADAVEIAECVSQMRGEAGDRQIAEPPRAGIVWGGGSGFNLCVTVLKSL